MRAIGAWIVAYLARWFPHRGSTGLFKVGDPGEHSPVIVTGNFTLTLKRVRKALAGCDVWLLVAQSEGINVWCAAAGKILTEGRIIDAIKVGRLAEVVAHRMVILPPLAAPGVDREALRRETGFRSRFGPVLAEDIPRFLDAGMKRSEDMRRFPFGWKHRLDMLLPMNAPVYLFVAAVLALVAPQHLVGFTVVFWVAVAFLYAFVDLVPGKTGWGQAMWSAFAAVVVWAGFDWYSRGDPFAHRGWMVAIFLIFFGAGFDLAGILSPRSSDPERMMHRLGFNRFGALFVERQPGKVQLDRDRCEGCLTCWAICPIGVFQGLGPDGKVAFTDPDACFSCGACVKQCPEMALSLADA